MAGILGAAVLQEAITRVSSVIFRKHEEKVSRKDSIERLEMAHTELELAIERSGKLPITDVSLLRRRKILKCAFIECSDVLHRCKLQAQEDQETETGVTPTDSCFPKRIARATKSSIAYFLTTGKDDLNCYDVGRFERLADCASKFVRDMESGCSLWHFTFCNPLFRHLLQGKMLEYDVEQRDLQRRFHVWPINLEERGVEAELAYRYDDHKMTHKSFQLQLMLRLSESTDVIGIAIECLQSLAPQHMTRSAIGELTLLHDVKDISKYALPWVGIQELHTQDTWNYRPDPMCCKSNGQESCANNINISSTFPEQVIFIAFQCYSALQNSLCHSSSGKASRNVMKDRTPPLQVTAFCAPHFREDLQVQESSTFKHKIGSIREMEKMVRTKATHLPEQSYSALWLSAHGSAYFHVWKPCGGIASVLEPKGRSKTWRAAKRKR